MTVQRLQAKLTELERQVARLNSYLDGYKTGMLDYDELVTVVNVSLLQIRETADIDRRQAA